MTDPLRLLVAVLSPLPLFAADLTSPIVPDGVVLEERDGIVAVEAEHFFQQTLTDVRAWHLTTSRTSPQIAPDGDAANVGGASGGAYVEVLPDTRRTHDDRLISGQNFSNEPGRLAVLHYRVHFTTIGRYYVWVRAHSTGSEDNGIHAGIDGTWPESGQRMQWCAGKRTWHWESRQRTQKEQCGEPHLIYLDVKKPGDHIIQFSMREDGFEFDKWLLTTKREFSRPADTGPPALVRTGRLPEPFPFVAARTPEPPEPAAESGSGSPTKPVSDRPLIQPRQSDGSDTIEISGELKTWHNITMTLDGPFAHEQDNEPNPFTDFRLEVEFTHANGGRYVVPGYFAADGNAANTSAESGTKWRVHFAPDTHGEWTWKVTFRRGRLAALDRESPAESITSLDGRSGTIRVSPTDRTGRDLRAQGRLQYVGKRYLQFAGSKRYFLKAGADAPETLLACADFDNTHAGNPRKAPLKTWSPHTKDWSEGDPTWRDGQGKGLIGAVNYLSGKGCNAFSFLTYNAGGDGDNVWPFIHRDDKLHYDCSKLDQWAIVFEHGTHCGMYLHFKMQETEMDDHRQQGRDFVPESLDGGALGIQRRLYCRELVARFAHNLALNWNLGEENTQSTAQQKAMISCIAELDAYDHNIVVHTFPEQQDKVYRPLLGDRSGLTGVSLQNSSLETTHAQTVKWVDASTAAGRPWIVAFDESGSAAHAQCPDLGYRGFDGHDSTGQMIYTQHKVRKQTLWGTLMAGGAGCEYYFGYRFAENDIVCEDWRSRDQSWNYCRIAINFFHDNSIPFDEMKNSDELVGNPNHGTSRYCFAKPNDTYLVYLPDGGTASLDLGDASGSYTLQWFNPRTGGPLTTGSIRTIAGGIMVSLGSPPEDIGEDWLAVLRLR
ncbi:MAG: DUF5060 domain-containing protein [Planctomycetota bacterium]|nr:DUF5060 domain-containing protein [Planctomycetota bacterium]